MMHLRERPASRPPPSSPPLACPSTLPSSPYPPPLPSPPPPPPHPYLPPTSLPPTPSPLPPTPPLPLPSPLPPPPSSLSNQIPHTTLPSPLPTSLLPTPPPPSPPSPSLPSPPPSPLLPPLFVSLLSSYFLASYTAPYPTLSPSLSTLHPFFFVRTSPVVADALPFISSPPYLISHLYHPSDPCPPARDLHSPLPISPNLPLPIDLSFSRLARLRPPARDIRRSRFVHSPPSLAPLLHVAACNDSNLALMRTPPPPALPPPSSSQQQRRPEAAGNNAPPGGLRRMPASVFDDLNPMCGLKLRYFECGVPKYGNSFSTSVCGFRPVGGHSFFVRKAMR